MRKHLTLLALGITALAFNNNPSARTNQEKTLCSNVAQIFSILANAEDEKLIQYSPEAKAIKEAIKNWQNVKLVNAETPYLLASTIKVPVSKELSDILLRNTDLLCSETRTEFKTVQQAAKNRETIKNIAELYKKQKAEPYAVVGGLSTLLKNSEGPYIKFYPVETPKFPIIHELTSCKNDWKCTLNLLKTKFELVEELDYCDTDRVKFFISFFESDASEKRKNLSSNLLIEGYEKKVHRLYMSSAEAMLKLTLEQKIEGLYLGLFHVHLSGEPPTETDKEIGEKEILIAFKKNGYDMYMLPTAEKTSYQSKTWDKIIKD